MRRKQDTLSRNAEVGPYALLSVPGKRNKTVIVTPPQVKNP